MEKPPVVLYLEPEPSLQYHPSRDALAYILSRRGCLLERVQITPPFVDRIVAIQTWIESGRLKLVLLDEGLATEAHVITELLQQVAPDFPLLQLSHSTAAGLGMIRPCDAASLARVISHLPPEQQPLPHLTVPESVRRVYDEEWEHLRNLSTPGAAALVGVLFRIVQEELRRAKAESHGADYDGSYQRHVGFAFHPATEQRCLVGGLGLHNKAMTHLRARIAAIRQWGVAAPGDVVFGTVTHSVPGCETPLLQILSIGVDWSREDCATLARFLRQTAMYLPVDHTGRLIERLGQTGGLPYFLVGRTSLSTNDRRTGVPGSLLWYNNSMRFDILTIFPDAFSSYLSTSIVGRAQRKKKIQIITHDLRQFTSDRHRTVDDKPYGGGVGMVMMVEPFAKALRKIVPKRSATTRTILLSARGRRFTQKDARTYAQEYRRLVFLCGRYEGVDERVSSLVDEELSIGEFVLTGGELGAMVIIDAVSRLLPGVLGKDASSADESFSDDLTVEYPQYTRPEAYKGMKVPSALLSGDHQKIAAWREKMRTKPDAPTSL